MTTIIKQFNTLKQAERFHYRLYEQYNHVRLVDWPRWSEKGTYTWEVK